MTGFKGDKFIIDSYGWIEYFSDGALAGKYSKYIDKCNPEKYVTPSIIIYEVYKKFVTYYSEEEAISAVMHIDNYTEVVDIDISIAMKGAEVSTSEKLPMADALIYSIGIKHGAKIITSDKHFRNKDHVIYIK